MVPKEHHSDFTTLALFNTTGVDSGLMAHRVVVLDRPATTNKALVVTPMLRLPA